MDDREEDLADLIMRRLSELGLSQTALAREAGISADTVRKVLRGDGQSFRRLTLSSLSQALGWPSDALERLLHGEEDPWSDARRHPWPANGTQAGAGAAADEEHASMPSADEDSGVGDLGEALHADTADADLHRRVDRLERIMLDRAGAESGVTLEDLRRRVARLEDLALDRLATS